MKTPAVHPTTGAPSKAARNNRKDVARARGGLEAELLTASPGRAAKIRAAIAATEKQHHIGLLQAKWAPWEGTPETNEAIARVPSHRRQSPLARMARMGKIDADDLASAHEIAAIVEAIARGVALGCAPLEARVDCAGSGKDTLVESLGRVRREVAYRSWRDAIPEPKAMILDMIVRDVNYVRTAKHYGLHWQTARKRLIKALRMWPSFKIDAKHAVGKDEVNEVYAGLGDGALIDTHRDTRSAR